MNREELREVLVERAIKTLYPIGNPTSWGNARLSVDFGAVIDALGILDAVEALDWAIPMASAHVEYLARQPSGHQEFIREERDELKKAEAALRRIRGERG